MRNLFLVAVMGLVFYGSINGLAYTQNDADGLTAGQIVRKIDPKTVRSVYVDQHLLLEKMEEGRKNGTLFRLVDLRLESDYEKGHIVGAVSIPLSKLRFLAEQSLGKQDDIVFYGYSDGDAASLNAVILLINKGFERIGLLKGGIREWRGEI